MKQYTRILVVGAGALVALGALTACSGGSLASRIAYQRDHERGGPDAVVGDVHR